MTFKEEKLPFDSFIGGWYMEEKLCDDLINYYKLNPELQFDGVVASEVRPEEKLSKDISIQMHKDFEGKDIFDNYLQNLFKMVKLYEKKYTEYGMMDYYGICEQFNIQHYKPGGGFYKWHSERMTHRNRCLVFMTYLNDVEDGGTSFKYQNIDTPAQKGLTVLWPAYWTHTHKGIINNTKEKYIATGWINYIEHRNMQIQQGRIQ